MSLKPFRIYDGWAKVSFFLLWASVLFGGNVLLAGLLSTPLYNAVYISAINTAFAAVGFRCFRGVREERSPARPWWRATGGAVSSVVVGVAALVGVASEVVAITTLGGSTAAFFLSHGVLLLQFSFVSLYCIHSAFRSLRSDTGAGASFRTFRP